MELVEYGPRQPIDLPRNLGMIINANNAGFQGHLIPPKQSRDPGLPGLLSIPIY